MKRYSLLLLTALAAAACSKDLPEEIEPIYNGGTGTLTLHATTERGDTRMTTDDGLSFDIVENEERIGVYLQLPGVWTEENILFTAGAADDRGWVTFQQAEQSLLQLQNGIKILAYAPYTANSGSISGSVEGGATEQSTTRAVWDGTRTLTLADLQHQAAASDYKHLPDYYAVVATPTEPTTEDNRNYKADLRFSGVFALARFVVTNPASASAVTISKLVFSAEGSALTGDFRVDLTAENPSIANAAYAPQPVADKTYDRVTVQLDTPVTLQAGEKTELFAVVNAGTVEHPKMEVYATDETGKEIVYTKDSFSQPSYEITRQKRAAFGFTLESGTEYDYAQEVADALVKGGSIVIERDVDLSEKGQIVIPAGTQVELNVPKGISLTLEADQIDNEGELHISGGGVMTGDRGIVRNRGGKVTIDGITVRTVNATRGSGIVQMSGEMVIEDCRVEASFYALYCEGGKITVNGGTFKSTSDNRDNTWAYSVRCTGSNTEMVIHNATIEGVQGALSADNGATLVINDGRYSTYGAADGSGRNYYALYTANVGSATINGGYFFREGQANCIYTGDNDIAGQENGIICLKGGYFMDQGYNQFTEQKIRAAEGYKWEKLDEPVTIVNEENGKTNTYSYRIVKAAPWNGEVEEPAYDEASKSYTVTNAAQLAWIAEQVNAGDTFAGKTVVLAGDIDLNSYAWTPIGTSDPPFSGIFDGAGGTISNLVVNLPEQSFVGLFGRIATSGNTPATLKNITIRNAAVTGLSQVGAVAGSAYTGRVESCSVEGDIRIEGNYQTGGISGYGYASFAECSVTGEAGSYVKGIFKKSDLEGDATGGIVGYAAEKSDPEAAVIDRCSASIDVEGSRKVGGIAGQVGTYANLSGCTFSGNVKTNAPEQYIADNKGKIMVGGIFGELAGGTPVINIRPCTVASGSTVTGCDAATTGLLYGGCRNASHTINSTGNTTDGARLIVPLPEGIEQVSETAYRVTGRTGLSNFAALINAGDDFAGKTVTLTEDVDLTGLEWTPIANGSRSGAIAKGQTFKGTFDGNGMTVKNMTITTTPSADHAIGLVGVVDGGTIRNLNLIVDIQAESELAGAAAGMLLNGATVSGVEVRGRMAVKNGGGIVGRAIRSATLTDCRNYAEISGTVANVGGIIGAAYYTAKNKKIVIEGCENHGAVSSTTGVVGGIVGLSAAEIRNCTNDQPITGKGTSVGGIVGEQQNAGLVSGCTNTADVTNQADAYGTGGIVGWLRYSGTQTAYPAKNIISVIGNTNRGSVLGGNGVGGIVGVAYNFGVINENKNYAPELRSSSTFAAGIVGNTQFTESTPGLDGENRIEVKNNLSTTSIENITGTSKDLFVYINNAAKVSAEGNTQQ